MVLKPQQRVRISFVRRFGDLVNGLRSNVGDTVILQSIGVRGSINRGEVTLGTLVGAIFNTAVSV